MTTAARATKQIIQTYKAVKLAEMQTQAKLDALLTTNAQYIVLEHDTSHPYFALVDVAKRLVAEFEILVAGVVNWKIGSSTIEEQLDYVKGRQIVNDQQQDADVEALRALQSIQMTEAQAAQQLITLLLCASDVWSKSEPAAIDSALEMLHGKKLVARHKETNEQKITKDCRAAMTDIKKVAKELSVCSAGQSTVRQELEKILALKLSNCRSDGVIEFLLK